MERNQLEPRIAQLVKHRRQRTLEGCIAKQHGLDLISDTEATRQTGLLGKLRQNSPTRGMDRPDPTTLDEWNQIVTSLKAQATTNAFAHLARGPRGEGDGQHLRRQVVALRHGSHITLDQYRGLARASSGIDENPARRLDSRELGRRQLGPWKAHGHRSTRQIPR